MSYAQVDDLFWDHPKVVGLLSQPGGITAIGLWTLALTWSHHNVRVHGPGYAGQIPAAKVYQWAGGPHHECSPQELTALLVDAGLWEPTDYGWLIHEFWQWQDLSTWLAKSEGGRRSGAARRAKAAGMDPLWADAEDSSDDAVNSHRKSVANHRTENSNHRSNPLGHGSAATGGNGRLSEAELGRLFGEFWAVWVTGRKVGKDSAARAFAAAVCRRGADPQAIIAGARRFAADPNLPADRQFVPHPATWLNGGRWDDDPLPPRGEDEPPPGTWQPV